MSAETSPLVSGALSLAGVVTGFLLGRFGDALARRSKARSLRQMLADEVELNRSGLKNWTPGSDWPVRSVYIWQSLQAIVPGFLSAEEIKALAVFYYRQAEIYKDRDRGKPLTSSAVAALTDAAGETLVILGRSAAA